MAQENSISITFSAAEKQSIADALAQIAHIAEGKLISLNARQRQQFGRVKYEKEIFVDKAKLHMDAHPELVPAWVDKEEYDRDYEAHKFINTIIAQAAGLLSQFEDTNILLGYDLDTASNTFYQNAKTAARANALGARTVYEDLKQQYPGAGAHRQQDDEKKI